MRIFKNILIGFGTLFLLLVALFSWVGMTGHQFRKAEEPFVQKFVTDLSRHWDPADVRDRMADTLIEQIDTAQVRQLMQQFRQLGPLKSVQDFELQSYKTTTSRKTGLFHFKGTFENGNGEVQVSLVENGGVVRVQGFSLRGIHVSGTSKLQT
jgi:hypothetical protein